MQEAMTILLVDDHPMFLDAMGAALKDKFPGTVLIPTGSISEAREALRVDALPDLAVVDIDLPDGDGAHLIKELHENYEMKTIAFSGHADRLTINACVSAGASGFVSKASDFSMFHLAVQAVLSGSVFFPAYAMRSDGQNPAEVSLTKRQLDVLDLVLSGESNQSIAEKLCLTEGTVRNHASALHAIFNTTSRHQLIAKARRLYRPDPRSSR